MKFGFVCVAVLFIGCSHMQYREVPEYKITKMGPFILSESPELWKVFDRSLSKTERRLNFLIVNKDSGTHKLLLDQAVLTINLEKKSIFCENFASSKAAVVLRQDQTFQVQCKIDVIPNSENQLVNKDSLAKLEIPTDSGLAVSIERVFRIEEFKE
ncbi:hypothetical protein Bb109J_c2855 [Bdellovibrio bacteriovorus]|uniref:hypothetical protein n=1 Tax=Bdellovibrio bacteriovorus TaxID=959 RepID=UPI00045BFC4E|nr:hypothetical protein [Bdellovibrio bacteriovorus]AHZ83465.1 hypothetical protein EP01_00685 [Bdellovibrio bacteriovorus]BEV69435.1 hypothetical protein Bb109J_c2855 [Bdellovibrio bacteriovorus]